MRTIVIPVNDKQAISGGRSVSEPFWSSIRQLRYGSKYSRLNFVIGFFSLVLIAALWFGALERIGFEHAAEIADETRANDNLALVLEEQTVRTVKAVDQTIRFVGKEYEQLGRKLSLRKMIEDGDIDGSLFTNIAVVDDRGNMLLNNIDFPPTNLADREYFQVLKQRDSHQMFIGKPLYGRVSKVWTFHMARRINKPDGSFGGVIYAGVDPSYFLQIYQQAHFGDHGLIALVGLDGITRARRVGQVRSFGQDIGQNMLHALQDQNKVGSALIPDSVDGIRRFISYRTLKDYPLMVMIGSSETEAMAPFHDRERLYYLVAMLTTASIAAFALGLMSSLSRQRRAFDALAGSEAQLHATFDQAAVGIARAALDGRFLQVNPKLCTMLGYSEQELLARTFFDITHPADITRTDNVVKELLTGRTETRSHELEKRYVRKDGSVAWVTITNTMVGGKEGNPDYLIAIIQDVSERKIAEEALRLRNRAIESSVNAILIAEYHKPDTRIVYANPAFERMTGYSAADAIASKGLFLQKDDRDQPGIQEFYSALREEREGHAVLRSYRKDGSLFWNDMYLAPVPDDAGQVTHFVSVLSDITEAKNYELQLERQANYDALTGMANRNLLNDRLSRAIAYAHRHKDLVAVLVINLDQFNLINDSLGHGAGDELLKIVAERLKSCVRDSDTVARVGGDEFALVLTELTKEDAVGGVVSRIINAVSCSPRVDEVLQSVLGSVSQSVVLDVREISVTCSIGLSLYPQDGRDAETLLKNADAAMYRAKELGRNNFQFYTAELNARTGERLTLQGMLRRALEREEFSLYYQPKVDLPSGRVSSVEGLLRWKTPERGLIPPNHFIPILEETGMIIAVGRWVMAKALSDYRQWQAEGRQPLRIAVNVSQVQLVQKTFVAVVEEIIKESGECAVALDLEITESLLMRDVEANIAKLKALRDMGIGIAIDDFGTGYSSLNYLAKVPADALKIDRAFIMNLTTNADNLTIVSTIISLAHSLKLKVIAEGVETEEQLKLLRRLECDEIQGYLASPALPATEFWKWHQSYSIKS